MKEGREGWKVEKEGRDREGKEGRRVGEGGKVEKEGREGEKGPGRREWREGKGMLTIMRL